LKRFEIESSPEFKNNLGKK